jgi:hypothetical protein
MSLWDGPFLGTGLGLGIPIVFFVVGSPFACRAFLYV